MRYIRKVVVSIAAMVAMSIVMLAVFSGTQSVGENAGLDITRSITSVPKGPSSPPEKTHTPHANIVIEGDTAFTPANGVTGGTGTKTDPYIISGWEFNFTSSIGIWVRNTTLNFTIRDCKFTADTGTTITYYAAVHMTNVFHGSVSNCTMGNGFSGIALYGCLGITVDKCHIYMNNIGIILNGTSYSVITDNVIAQNFWMGAHISTDSSSPIILPGYNRFCYNNFADNAGMGTQAYDSQERNIWNASDRGNYWSDWTGPDTDHDGIVDYPYPLAGSVGAKDYKPIAPGKVTESVPSTVAVLMLSAIVVLSAVMRRTE